MPLRKIGLFALLLCLTFASCKKDPLPPEKEKEVPIYEIPEQIVIASLSGVAFDEDLKPLTQALVKVGSQSLLTDENGVFYFQNISLNSLGALVEVEKAGYFKGFKMVESQQGKRASTRIILVEKTEVGIVDAENGGTVEAQGGSKITLPAQGFVTAAGTAYSGKVTVFAKWMDPSDNNTNRIMPGDLRAINESQEAVQLATLGMITVELEGASGEALQLADGSLAKLEIPVPESLRSAAPATIPLWHFDESTGYWIEEGEAVFDGTQYLGEVAHFTTWNFDIPFEKVNLEGLVTDQQGNPLSDMDVRIQINSSLLTRNGLTDQDGRFSGGVPKGEELKITISAYGWCETEIYTAIIGPFNSDAVLPTIVLDLSNVNNGSSLLISGNLEDCAGNPISNGYLKVYRAGEIHLLYPDANGAVSKVTFYCTDTQVGVEGYDITNEKKSSIASYNVAGLTELDFGTLSVCDDLVEFFNYSIDGNDFSVLDPSAAVTAAGGLVINAEGTSADSTFNSINLELAEIGIQNPVYASFAGEETGVYYFASCQTCDDFEVTLTAMGAAGETVEGSFAGEMLGYPSGTMVSVSGAFKVIRD